jgi:hypothetical protein
VKLAKVHFFVRRVVNLGDIIIVGMSIFRHNGCWYVGDMTNWPPVTNYRCGSGCPKDEDTPPEMTFETNAKKGKDPPPSLSHEPCSKQEL